MTLNTMTETDFLFNRRELASGETFCLFQVGVCLKWDVPCILKDKLGRISSEGTKMR